MLSKTDISKRFRALEKLGFAVYTFNDRRAINAGAKGWVDHVIVGHNRVIFVEIKLSRDVFSPAQERTRNKLSQVEAYTDCVRYYLVNESNFDGIYRTIENAATKKK